MHIEKTEKKKLIQQLKKILIKGEKVLFAYLHGSSIGEEEFNDIDIALYLDEKIMEGIKLVW